MLHSSDPLPSKLEEMMGRGGRRGVPKDPLEKMMAVGVGGDRAEEDEDGDKNKTREKMRNGWCLSCGSSCAPWQGPGDCFCQRIAAESFQRFPSNTFLEIITSIWRKRPDKGTETLGLLEPPTCPHDLHSAATARKEKKKN